MGGDNKGKFKGGLIVDFIEFYKKYQKLMGESSVITPLPPEEVAHLFAAMVVFSDNLFKKYKEETRKYYRSRKEGK